MKPQKNLIMSCLMILVLSGCDIFPYVRDVATQTPAPPTGQATRTNPPPTTTSEPTPTTTETPTSPTETPGPDTAITPPAFIPQDGSPIYLSNFTHPEVGCQWLGVAGQVFNEQGLELMDLTVTAGSSEEGNEPKLISITGMETAYGPGGYEIQLSTALLDSSRTYWVQVFDTDGTALTDQIYFDTYNDCSRNLILVNFIPSETLNIQGGEGITPTLAAYP